MATIKLLLNELYADKDGLFPIIIRVEHRGKRRKVPVGFKVSKKYWDGTAITSKHPDAALINAAISSKLAEIRHYLADCKLHDKPIHLDLIGTGRVSYSFTGYLRRRSEQYLAAGRASLSEKGKVIMSQKVDRYIRELEAVAGGELYFEDITLDFLRRLDQHLIENGNGENTRHQKFKRLGEFYDQAVLEGKAAGANPFDNYKIPTRPSGKQKLSAAEIKAIENLQLKPGPVTDARNLFLFSYYTKGQRFEVCITLRRAQIMDGRIVIITNKGKDHMSVKIHSRLQAILDQYASDGDLLFPFLKEIPADSKAYIKAIDSQNTVFNRNLKIVGALAKISKPLTFHIARHSFADQLSDLTDSISVIQAALGHSDEKTTRAYLNALKDERLDPEMEKLYGQ